MLSEAMTGAVAEQIGVIAFAKPEAEVEAAAVSLAQQLGAGPTKSFTAISTLLKAWAGGGIAAADSILLDVTMPLHGSEDARSGRQARMDAIRDNTTPKRPTFVGR